MNYSWLAVLLCALLASVAAIGERHRRAINPFLDSMGKRAMNPFVDSFGKRAMAKRYFDSLAGQSLGKRSGFPPIDRYTY